MAPVHYEYDDSLRGAIYGATPDSGVPGPDPARRVPPRGRRRSWETSPAGPTSAG